MKTFAVATALAVASQVTPTQAWWDNGHMLVGQVATQLMDKADVATIHNLLAKWNEDFPLTDEIATAAIWPDLIKCTSKSDYCASDRIPSFLSFNDWHYVDLPLDIAGGKWGGYDANDLALFNFSLGGNAVDVVESSLKTLLTTNSSWAANLVIRNLIHIVGDLHQPLHTVAGVNADLPGGDGGGNSFVFKSPCAFNNLHALWDAAGGVYSQNNWSPNATLMAERQPILEANATTLIGLLPMISDNVNFDKYKSLQYDAFYKAVVTNDKAIRRVVLDSYEIATQIMYKGLDLTFDNKKVACPPQWYIDWAAQYAQFRIATGGKRLAVILTQIAKQLRARGLSM